MSIIAQARNLTKHFADFIAVDNINFDVYRGDCLGILGPNGAGKTTTLRMLLGHVTPTAGSLSALGYELPRQARAMRSLIGVVPQDDNLDVDLSVEENLFCYAKYFNFRKTEIASRIKHLLQFAELTEKANAAVNSLSGGMRRRLCLARALINTPELLILDEPTTGLDPQARQLLWQRLRELKSNGSTLILTTHYMEEAERLCDRILLIDHGKVLAEGSPQALIKQHIEVNVMEVHGVGVDEWYQTQRNNFDCRVEIVGDTLFCYADQDLRERASLSQQAAFQIAHRRANLEDVFLKLTGRELRDN